MKTIKIKDTGKGAKSVGKTWRQSWKIEGWHQSSIAGFLISYRDPLCSVIKRNHGRQLRWLGYFHSIQGEKSSQKTNTMNHTETSFTRSALVTGTSTGIGRATSLRLAAEGVKAFAGVRRSADGDGLVREASRLAKSASDKKGRIIPLVLDVTSNTSIQNAIERVQEETGADGLWALVNNAGIAVGGPVEQVSSADWRRQFDVNFFGWIEVIRAALPLLRKGVRAQGVYIPRVVLVSSIGGRIAQPILAPYACSKWATTALGDSLRLELRRQGIGVSIIEPGVIATPIWSKGEASLAEIDPNHPARELYSAEIDGLRKAAARGAATAIPPERAADTQSCAP